MRIGRRVSLASLALVIFLPALSPSGAFAHTKLLSSSPAAGATVTAWPEKIQLEFDDALINLGDEKSNFVVVNNAQGDQVSNNDESVESNFISVSLTENMVEGPVLVYYRVVASDGHPVEGEFKFSFGQDENTISTNLDKDKSSNYPIGIYIGSAAFIATGIFFAIYSYRRRLKD